MKRGTASRVFFGVDKTNEDFGGLLLLSQVTLGKKSGMFDEHKGLCIVDNVLLGKGIARVISVIIRGTSPLTLPDAIADSLSYVKAFGGTEQRNLPSGYTELEYIEGTGTQYIDTNLTTNQGDISYVFDFMPTELPGSGYYSILGRDSNYQAGYNDSGRAYIGNATSTNVFYSVNTKATVSGTLSSTEANGVYYVDGVNTGLTRGLSASTPAYLFSAGTGHVAKGKLYNFSATRSGNTIMNLIPAKNSSNVVGMYDTVTGNFLTNQGTGTFAAGGEAVPTTDAPVDIWCNNGVLKASPNLLNNPTWLSGYINTTGLLVQSSGSTLNFYPVSPNTTYTFSYTKGNASNFYDRIAGYSSKTENSFTEILSQKDFRSYAEGARLTSTFTTGANTNYIRIGTFCGNEPTGTPAPQPQLELGSTATPYMPYGIYTDGTVETIADSANHTATVQRLLAVGDYKDEQNINTGTITRKVGIKVLDGTEGWAASSASSNLFYSADAITNADTSNNYKPISTHFNGVLGSTGYSAMQAYDFKHGSGTSTFYFKIPNITTADECIQWLKAQYANGTPVIVVYPLATPTTESVTGQTLQVTDGDNTLEITQASLNNLELEAQYQAAVSLTIQEVQDANLDPNVEVTIN